MAKNSSMTNEAQLQDVRNALNALDTAVGALGEGSGVHPATQTAVESAGNTAASKAADRSAGPSIDRVSYAQLQELVSNQLADVVLKDPGCSQLLQLLAATSPYKDQGPDGSFPVLFMALFGSAASSPSSGIQRFKPVQGGSDAGTGDAGAGTVDAGTTGSGGSFSFSCGQTGFLNVSYSQDAGFNVSFGSPGVGGNLNVKP
jgi:hypothetical protein